MYRSKAPPPCGLRHLRDLSHRNDGVASIEVFDLLPQPGHSGAKGWVSWVLPCLFHQVEEVLQSFLNET